MYIKTGQFSRTHLPIFIQILIWGRIQCEIVLERALILILNVVNDTIIHFDERVQLEKNDILENICSFIDFKNCLF